MMDINEANRLIENQISFKYSSLRYSDAEALLEYEILCDNKDAIILAGPYENNTKIYWAVNSEKYLLDIISGIKGTLYIEFIPEGFVNQLQNIGFSIYSEFLDFFSMDLGKYAIPSINTDIINFLDSTECGEAAKLTQECRSDSRGFNGETKGWFEDWIGSEYGKVIAAKENGTIIGLCCITFYGFENDKGPILWVREIAVKRNFRGMGIGKKLLEQAVSFAVSKGINRGFLHSDVENKNAIALYNKFGFFSKPERGQINMIKKE